MKKKLLLFVAMLLSVHSLIIGQNVELLGSLNTQPGFDYSDIWGYAANGREYALMGITNGTSIIDVTNPASPVQVDVIPGPPAPAYEWRDIKTHLNFAYIISEGTGYYSIVQVLGKYLKGSLPPFDVIKDKIEIRYLAEKRNKLIEDYIENLYTTNEIEVIN